MCHYQIFKLKYVYILTRNDINSSLFRHAFRRNFISHSCDGVSIRTDETYSFLFL